MAAAVVILMTLCHRSLGEARTFLRHAVTEPKLSAQDSLKMTGSYEGHTDCTDTAHTGTHTHTHTHTPHTHTHTLRIDHSALALGWEKRDRGNIQSWGSIEEGPGPGKFFNSDNSQFTCYMSMTVIKNCLEQLVERVFRFNERCIQKNSQACIDTRHVGKKIRMIP